MRSQPLQHGQRKMLTVLLIPPVLQIYVPSGTYTVRHGRHFSVRFHQQQESMRKHSTSSDVTGINFTLNRNNNGNITVTVRNSAGTAVEGNFVWAEKFNKNTKQFIAYGNGASTDQAGQVILNLAKNNSSTEIYYVKTLGTNDETLVISNNVNIATADSNLGIYTLPTYQQITFNVTGIPTGITQAEINIHNDTTDNWSTAQIAVANGVGSTTVSLGAGSYTGYMSVNGASEITKTFTVSGSAASVSFDLSTTQFTAHRV